MSKKLTEMSLEELWQLFPIILTKHQEDWKEWYLEEERLLKNILPQAEKISHIGSTAIPAIWAKPIIDIICRGSFILFDKLEFVLLSNQFEFKGLCT